MASPQTSARSPRMYDCLQCQCTNRACAGKVNYLLVSFISLNVCNVYSNVSEIQQLKVLFFSLLLLSKGTIMFCSMMRGTCLCTHSQLYYKQKHVLICSASTDPLGGNGKYELAFSQLMFEWQRAYGVLSSDKTLPSFSENNKRWVSEKV